MRFNNTAVHRIKVNFDFFSGLVGAVDFIASARLFEFFNRIPFSFNFFLEVRFRHPFVFGLIRTSLFGVGSECTAKRECDQESSKHKNSPFRGTDPGDSIQEI